MLIQYTFKLRAEHSRL